MKYKISKTLGEALPREKLQELVNQQRGKNGKNENGVTH